MILDVLIRNILAITIITEKDAWTFSQSILLKQI